MLCNLDLKGQVILPKTSKEINSLMLFEVLVIIILINKV